MPATETNALRNCEMDVNPRKHKEALRTYRLQRSLPSLTPF